MRVEFKEHDSDYELSGAASEAVSHYFLSGYSQAGHPDRKMYGAIDGVPFNRKAGFPEMPGWDTPLLGILREFVVLRVDLANHVLSLSFKHDGHKPVQMRGSFHLRVHRRGEQDSFLEVNFQEELDGGCADPVEVLGLWSPEDFTMSRILMSGQRRLSVEPIGNTKCSSCLTMAKMIERALVSQRGRYGWPKKETLAGREMHPGLRLRAARFELALVEEGFSLPPGTLGLTTKHLAAQYLT